MDHLYDTDALTWSERQAALLRRIAAGDHPNEEPDWLNVIEEIESVGKSELRAVRSALVQAMTHELKSRAWPDSLAAPHWRAETRQFRRQAERDFTESMRQHLDLPRLYRDALAGLPEVVDFQPPRNVPAECPFTLDELLGHDPAS